MLLCFPSKHFTSGEKLSTSLGHTPELDEGEKVKHETDEADDDNDDDYNNNDDDEEVEEESKSKGEIKKNSSIKCGKFP
jgi:hypothetical protein